MGILNFDHKDKDIKNFHKELSTKHKRQKKFIKLEELFDQSLDVLSILMNSPLMKFIN